MNNLPLLHLLPEEYPHLFAISSEGIMVKRSEVVRNGHRFYETFVPDELKRGQFKGTHLVSRYVGLYQFLPQYLDWYETKFGLVRLADDDEFHNAAKDPRIAENIMYYHGQGYDVGQVAKIIGITRQNMRYKFTQLGLDYGHK